MAHPIKYFNHVVSPSKNKFFFSHIIEILVEFFQLITFHLIADILFKNSFDNKWPWSEKKIIEWNVIVIINRLSTETIIKCIKNMRCC